MKLPDAKGLKKLKERGLNKIRKPNIGGLFKQLGEEIHERLFFGKGLEERAIFHIKREMRRSNRRKNHGKMVDPIYSVYYSREDKSRIQPGAELRLQDKAMAFLKEKNFDTGYPRLLVEIFYDNELVQGRVEVKGRLPVTDHETQLLKKAGSAPANPDPPPSADGGVGSDGGGGTNKPQPLPGYDQPQPEKNPQRITKQFKGGQAPVQHHSPTMREKDGGGGSENPTLKDDGSWRTSSLVGLQVIAGGPVGHVYALGEGSYVIGRSTEANLTLEGDIPDLAKISRKHCEITIIAMGNKEVRMQLDHLSKTSGTVINGKNLQIGSQTLKFNDEIQLVSLRLKVIPMQ